MFRGNRPSPGHTTIATARRFSAFGVGGRLRSISGGPAPPCSSPNSLYRDFSHSISRRSTPLACSSARKPSTVPIWVSRCIRTGTATPPGSSEAYQIVPRSAPSTSSSSGLLSRRYRVIRQPTAAPSNCWPSPGDSSPARHQQTPSRTGRGRQTPGLSMHMSSSR